MTELEALQSYRTTKPLSRAEEREAFIALRAGDTSQIDRITRANIRFVISIAKPYVHKGVALVDVVSSGSIGLLRAIRDFDHLQNFKFITYAIWWIRQQILFDFPQIKQRCPVYLPASVRHLHEKIRTTRPRLAQALQREPALGEVFDEIAKTKPELVTPGMRDRAIRTRFEPLSLDDPVNDDDQATYHDRISGGEDLLAHIEADDLQDHVAQLVDTLSEREQKIIRSYYGIDGQARTLVAIGTEIGVTRERVRQIKEVAMGKLRRRAERSALAEATL